MDLNRIIQALKGTIDPKLRIAAENELNQVRSGPAAPPAGPRLSLLGAPISTPRGAPDPRGSGLQRPPPSAPGSGPAALPGPFSEQPSHLLVNLGCFFFHVVSLPRCSLFSRAGPPRRGVKQQPLLLCFRV